MPVEDYPPDSEDGVSPRNKNMSIYGPSTQRQPSLHLRLRAYGEGFRAPLSMKTIMQIPNFPSIIAIYLGLPNIQVTEPHPPLPPNAAESGNVAPPCYKGLNNDQYHLEVRLRYHRPWLYKEYGTIILVTI